MTTNVPKALEQTKPFVHPIKGRAIFNETLVDYLCDGGADLTIINKRLFEKIKSQAQYTVLEPYLGKRLSSCTSNITVVGMIKLKKCIVDPQTILRDIEIIVTDHSATHECLLGRDILYRVPKLREHMEAMKRAVNSWSNQLDDFSEPKAHVDVQRIEMKALICSLSTQVEETYWKANGETTALNSMSNETEATDSGAEATNIEAVEKAKRMDSVRNTVQHELEKQSDGSLQELQPYKNARVAFKIRLLDANTRPIKCRIRPLAFHLKAKVKATLKEQEAAGIIRKSYSEWGSALRVVHKPDGTVRITVDYKPLNKIIKGDVYPLPNIAELYKRLADSDVFSKIDLKAAYHQIPMEEESIEYTALQVHQEELMALFKKISESHIKCSLEKSQLVTEEIGFLGNVVSKN